MPGSHSLPRSKREVNPIRVVSGPACSSCRLGVIFSTALMTVIETFRSCSDHLGLLLIMGLHALQRDGGKAASQRAPSQLCQCQQSSSEHGLQNEDYVFRVIRGKCYSFTGIILLSSPFPIAFHPSLLWQFLL